MHAVFASLAASAAVVFAQTLSYTSYTQECLQNKSMTAFPYCDEYFKPCPQPATDLPGKQQCMCKQSFFDAIIGCRNENRLCFLSNELDPTFDGAISGWHGLCDAVVTSPPTTLASATFTPQDDDFCQHELYRACQSARKLNSDCLSYVTDTTTESWSSCTCNPNLLREAYTCLFFGNTSCLNTPATLSEALGYGSCTEFASVIGTGLPGPTPVTLTSVPTLPSSLAPGASTAPVPTSTKGAGALIAPGILGAIFLPGLAGLLVAGLGA